jgi:aminopeptidase N
MKVCLAILGCFISVFVSAQAPYWQQQVNYTIGVALDDKVHSLTGTEEIEYINNSPDKLDFIWFHLWPNAYKNERTAFAKQLFRDDEGKKRWEKMRDKGSIEGLEFTVDGQKARLEADPDNIDIAKLILPSSLPAGGTIHIKTPFTVHIPSYSSRSGHDKQTYMICQWYPKPAVYDRKGWHAFPYLDQGEFYSEFGNYDVTLTVPSNYIVGATGELQDAAELQQYKDMGSKNVAASSRKNVVKYVAPASPVKALRYTAGNVHDFAWFADKDFVVRYDTLLLSSGKKVDVFTWHHPDGNKNWVNSTSYVKSGARSYSGYLGEYAYPVVQAVEGPKNEMSGGMEYPMITLITSPDATDEYLDGVITHEVGHNWLYGMLASNERNHAWMDEGINTYFQFRYEAEKYRTNSVFGKQLPAELKDKSASEFQMLIYNALSKIPMESPIDRPASEFSNKEDYGLIEYLKTSVWMYLMELDLGRENLDRAVKVYFNTWKFRHPYPEDFQSILEKEMNKNMTPYFELLKKKGNL